VLQSVEMMALARVCAIVHLAICQPVRWLAGNSQMLADHDWSVRSMGRVVDLLEPAIGYSSRHPKSGSKTTV